MMPNAIQLDKKTYQLLDRSARRLNLPPDQMLALALEVGLPKVLEAAKSKPAPEPVKPARAARRR